MAVLMDNSGIAAGAPSREHRSRRRSAWERAIGEVLLPGYDRFFKGRNTFRYLQQLERTQWLDRDAIASLQMDALERVLKHAAANVPYWEEWFHERGFTVRDVRNLDDFRKISTTDKDVIRANMPRMVARNHRGKTWTKSTGGSTGTPLTFEYTPDSYDWRVATSKRGYAWAGCLDGVRQVHIWGTAIGRRSRFADWKESLHHWVERKRYYSCFQISQERMEVWFRKLQKYRPSVIVGYTNPLFHFAEFVRQKGGLSFAPRSIITGAESLHEFQRKVISEAFRCEVYNTYGSREFMLIASECEQHSGLHLSAENLFVEILDSEGQPVRPGTMGEVAITDLHNYGMPFVRYRLGDLAVAADKTCACGRGLPLLEKVVGRSLDALVTDDGRFLPGEFFPHLMKDVAGVERFQVIQESRRKVVVKLVAGKAFGDPQRNAMHREIGRVLGPNCTVTYEFVDEIPLTRTGKHRVTISNLRGERENRPRH